MNEDLKRQLNSLGGFIKDQLELELINVKKEASGVLIKSLNFKVEETGTGFELSIFAQDYAKYVDKGVRGSRSSFKAPRSPYKYSNKMPPLEPLIKWVERKALASGNREILNLAWAIRVSIFRHGTETTNFIDKALSRAENDITRRVEAGELKDTSIFLDSIIKHKEININIAA